MTNSTPTPTRKNPLVLIIAALIGMQLLGALTFPVAKFGLGSIEPFTFAFYRFLISSIVLLAMVALGKKGVPIAKSDRWKIVGLGFLIIPLNQVTYLFGQSLTGVGHGSFLFATTPIWIFIAALIHLKEKLVIRRAVGIVIAMAGVVAIMTSGAIVISADYLWGDLIILVAVIAWAYYSVFGKPLVEKYGAVRVTAYALASGSVLYFPFGLYSAIAFDYSAVPAGAWLSVLYVAVGTSVGAYTLWYWVLKQMEVSRIAVYHNAQPIIATVVANLWLGEQFGPMFLIGGIVILVGVITAEL
ncbi:MAG: DMT family transporter [candidate division Zixibacteria bacterium]|nr:DMT family transporter [candidate division Zixibacteria bacterium]